MINREAGVTIYIQEELSDARLRCDELKNYVVRVLDLIHGSPNKDSFYAAAGDIIYSAPEALLKLEKALGAVSMAMNKVDYEETKMLIRPEKVQELERVLEDARINMPRRIGIK